MLNLKIVNDTGFKLKELDKKRIRKGLREIANVVKKDAQARLNKRGGSSLNDYPHRRSGDLRRAVQTVLGRRQAMWSKVQVGTIYSRAKGQQQKTKKDWYAGPLNYGTKSGSLRARKNAITDAQDNNINVVNDRMQDVLIEAINKCT